MSIEGFFAAISSPALKRVAAHWNAARAGRRIPGWSDIKPSSIAAQLPIVWSYKYDAERGEFIGRLAGDEITNVFGGTLHGRSLQQIFAADDLSWIIPMFRRVVTDPALYLGSGRVFRHLNRYGRGERIMLPLACDGVTADGIIGATEYDAGNMKPLEPEESPRETMQWFALD